MSGAIKILMMQRDEGTLLDSWIRYHSRLVGAQNLIILDNGSVDPETLEILNAAESAGLSVNYCPGRQQFEQKGFIFSDLIGAMDPAAGWVFPMDCDEFLCDFDETVPVFPNIENILSSLDDDKSVARITRSVFNIPSTSSGYFQYIQKVVVRAGFKVELDVGFHCYDWGRRASNLDPAVEQQVNFGYLHFHNKPFETLLRSAERKMEGRLDLADIEAFKRYNGDGMHLLKYFTMSQESYLRSFDGYNAKPLHAIFDKLGHSVPFQKGP